MRGQEYNTSTKQEHEKQKSRGSGAMLVGARGPPTADEGKDKIENKRIWVGKGTGGRGPGVGARWHRARALRYRLANESGPGSVEMLRAFRDPVRRDTDVHDERCGRRDAQQLNVMDPRPRWLLLALACSCLPHGELFIFISQLKDIIHRCDTIPVIFDQ